jgi:UTP--glucose-1-phosphate uridylyltransferase
MYKAVITAAGVGTRLLPATKEIPKEMFPVLVNRGGRWTLRPTLQVIFESLYDVGVRSFCFVVNRFKRVIENHFSPDPEFVDFLRSKGKDFEAEDLSEFYSKISSSTIVYINQYEPLGFGHAVLITEPFVGGEPFIVHAGDDYIISPGNSHLKRLISCFEEYKANAAILVEEVADPRSYGVIEGREVSDGIFEVTRIVEKPREPPSNLAVVAVYIFSKRIFHWLRAVGFDEGGEIPLSGAIHEMAVNDGGVYGVLLREGERRIDVGNPRAYIGSLNMLFRSMVGDEDLG